jgi:hypothetical protein
MLDVHVGIKLVYMLSEAPSHFCCCQQTWNVAQKSRETVRRTVQADEGEPTSNELRWH